MARRTSFVWWRRGVRDLPVIRAGSLEVYPASIGVTNVTAERLLPRGMRGHVDISRTFTGTLRLGDLLVTPANRVFVVLQVQPFPAFDRLSLAETYTPIPDEFEGSQDVEQFWTAEAIGAWVQTPATAILSTLRVTGATPLEVPWLHQPVTGDFDVYVQLRHNQAVVSAGTGYSFIKAGNAADDECAVVGLRQSAADGVEFYTRQIFGGSDSSAVSLLHAVGQWGFVRLRRQGVRVAAFVASTVEAPLREVDWKEIDGANVWFPSGDLLVGVGAYTDAGVTDPEPEWKFFRNWFPANR